MQATRRRFAALLLAGTLAPAVASAAQSANDGLRYSPLEWRVEGQVVRSLGRPLGIAVFEGLPLSDTVSIEADVTIDRQVGDEWKVAGVAVEQDHRNLWHFALVEGPEGGGRGHFCELAELRDGVWVAQGNLQRVVHEGAGAWQLGRTYRLRLTLDREGVEGRMTDRQGSLLCRIRFAFTAPAVTTGRPALRAGGFEARFANIATEVGKPVDVERPAPPHYASDSFVAEIRGKASGFFRVEEQGDGWWVIDPLGRGFVPLGIDHVRYEGHWCEKLGYCPHQRVNDAKYANREQWAEETLGRLRSWGFNLLAAGCSPELQQRGLAHTHFAAIGSSFAALGGEHEITPDEGRPCTAFPNVFHPDFEAFARHQAYCQCKPHADDPWLFGHFLDNELAWWGRGGLETGLFDAVMAKPPEHSAKRALRDFLARRYDGDVNQLEAAWQTELDSFDQLLTRTALSGKNRQAVTADKRAFLALVAERYFGTICGAIREVDPNHMILGCRFAGGHASQVVWETAGRHCEILTFNYYGNVDLDNRVARDHTDAHHGASLREAFAPFYRFGGCPMILTEWSFPALDSGLPCTEGAGQRFRTQTERAMATEIFARTVLALPFMVGYDYFMWVDEPALGITSRFPENTNYGLINEAGDPYGEITAALGRVHDEAGRIRRQRRPGGPVRSDEPSPPQGPAGTQWMLWNRTGRPLTAVTLWLPNVPSPSGATPTTLASHDGRSWQPTTTQWLRRPERPAAAVIRAGPFPPGAAVFLRGTPQENPLGGQAAHPSLQFERDGEAFRIETGTLALSGSLGSGPLVRDVRYRGVPLGSYNALLQHWDGEDHWAGTDTLVDVRAKRGPLSMSVDLVGRIERGPGGEPVAEIAHRLVFFPRCDWFVAELLWCRNLARGPLDVRAFFFWLETAIGGSSEGDKPYTDGEVPRLWGTVPGDAWIDAEAGAFWGVTATGRAGALIRFWLDEGGGRHPDARIEVTRTLPVGATFRPEVPLYVIGVAGRGDRATWERAVHDALEVIALPCAE